MMLDNRTRNVLTYAATVLERLDGELLQEIQKRPVVWTPSADLLRNLLTKIENEVVNEIPLQCPSCSQREPVKWLLYTPWPSYTPLIMATPDEPTIACSGCGTRYIISLEEPDYEEPE